MNNPPKFGASLSPSVLSTFMGTSAVIGIIAVMFLSVTLHLRAPISWFLELIAYALPAAIALLFGVRKTTAFCAAFVSDFSAAVCVGASGAMVAMGGGASATAYLVLFMICSAISCSTTWFALGFLKYSATDQTTQNKRFQLGYILATPGVLIFLALVYEMAKTVPILIAQRRGQESIRTQDIGRIALQLQSSSQINRAMAAGVLDQINIPDPLLPALVPLIDDPDPSIRKPVIRTIGRIATSSPEIVTRLCRHLNDSDDSAWNETTRALGRMGATSLDCLREKLESGGIREKTGAARVVAKLGSQASSLTPLILPLFSSGLRTKHDTANNAANEAFDALGDSALQPLLTVAERFNTAEGDAAQKVLAKFFHKDYEAFVAKNRPLIHRNYGDAGYKPMKERQQEDFGLTVHGPR
jgi:hypothetical protein